MEPIILASGSPRRQEYFRLLALPFSVLSAPVDETFGGLSPEPRAAAEELALRKVNRALELLEGKEAPWIFAADTLVALGGKIYGKPRDREDAGETLSALSGREHRVVSAIALYSGRKKSVDCRSVASTVNFASLEEEEIRWYLDTGEWQGAAGAYRIQGLGACFISSIQGSFSAIAGLPIREFYVMLRDNGYHLGRRESGEAGLPS
ncbi:MAG: Maf family protein [Treponema sp.]|jgi:septum formation protein|nr:Maf family protein [Treponema sp.]